MSAGGGIPLTEARAAAEEVADLLRPATRRLAIAGSVRRQKPVVHDIEIVVEPAERFELDIWGEPLKPAEDLFEAQVEALLGRGTFRLRDISRDNPTLQGTPSYRNGPRYKALRYRELPLDLFVVRPPATWGVTLFLRTGPWEWNQRVVTECQRRFRAFRDGQVLVMGRPVPADEERDVFEALGLDWVEPPERSAERVRWLSLTEAAR
jgi:DNA polymerase/3'-5' exonuclease PolX